MESLYITVFIVGILVTIITVGYRSGRDGHYGYDDIGCETFIGLMFSAMWPIVVGLAICFSIVYPIYWIAKKVGAKRR